MVGSRKERQGERKRDTNRNTTPKGWPDSVILNLV